MGLGTKLAKWVEEKITGEIVADYGVISSDSLGMTLSASLRRQSSGKYLFVLKSEGNKSCQWQSIEATPDALARFEAILSIARTQVRDGAKPADGQTG